MVHQFAATAEIDLQLHRCPVTWCSSKLTSALITDSFALTDIHQALDLLADSRECGKVMIEMGAAGTAS